MVSLLSAENALKTLYLGVVSEQLNTNINPLLAKIKQSTSDVWGKEIRKLAPYGLNGGVGAGTETGELPKAGGNKYAQFVLTLKNLYGTIEISDKAVRASESSAGAFVNLLNAEMEGLLRASSFNFGRMLFSDGTGVLTNITNVTGVTITVESVKYLMEGMIIDFYSPPANYNQTASKNRIVNIDRAEKKVQLAMPLIGVTAGDYITVQNSLNNEITGLEALFKSGGSLYGLNKSEYKWLNPYVKENGGDICDILIQSVIDTMEERAGNAVDFIICSAGVKRAYQNYLTSFKQNIDVMNLEGGYKALSYNGVPLISDRFCDNGTMYLLSTKDFVMHQLCDWSWLEGDDGKVIKQIPDKPVYRATLVKYADILCERPYGQAKITGINEI